MFKLLLCLIGLPFVLSLNDKHMDSWKKFKAKHNKVYSSDHEEMRFNIFKKNFDIIEKHNMGNHSYQLAINQFADLTNEEFQKRIFGIKANANRIGKRSSQSEPQLNVAHSRVKRALPDTVDWRKQGYVTPVKDQGQCGGCWAFSTTGSLEGQYARKTGKLESFSEQQLVDCSGDYGNNGCNGGLMDNAFQYIENYGIERESDYPYETTDDTCRYDASKVVTKISGFQDVAQGDEQALQTAVATVGPISVAIDASQFSFQFYSQGVYDEPDCSSTQLDHGVLAVGYGNEDGSDYWLVKNSWGTGWGMQGYIMMSRNADNQCGIATMASYPVM